MQNSKDKNQFREAARQAARVVWTLACETDQRGNHPATRAYFRAIGLDPLKFRSTADEERLGVVSLPACFRYCPASIVPDKAREVCGVRHPAIVAPLQLASGEIVGVVSMLCNERGEPRLDAGAFRESTIGSVRGAFVRVSDPPAGTPDADLLFVCDSVTTAVVMHAAMNGHANIVAVANSGVLEDFVPFAKDFCDRPITSIYAVTGVGKIGPAKARVKRDLAGMAAPAVKVWLAKCPTISTGAVLLPLGSPLVTYDKAAWGEERALAAAPAGPGVQQVTWLDVYRGAMQDCAGEAGAGAAEVYRIVFDSKGDAHAAVNRPAFQDVRAQETAIDALEVKKVVGGGGAGGAGSFSGGGGRAAWDPEDDSDWPVLEPDPVVRARRFLVEKCMGGDEGADGQRRIGLIRWGAKWWRWNGRAYQELSEEQLRSQVWAWMTRFRVIKGGKDPQLVRLVVNEDAVQSVIKAMVIDTLVFADGLPAVVPANIAADGRPRWGHASSMEAGRADMRAAADWLVFQDGIVDLNRLCDETLDVEQRLRVLPHRRELFTASTLPFEFPRAAMDRLISTGEREEVFSEMCPMLWPWMVEASDGDPVWITQWHEMLGDTMDANRAIEKIYGMVGMQRSGKGVGEEIIMAVCGEENIAALSTSNLEDKHGLGHLPGKRGAIMADAQIDAVMSPGMITERLKTISGQGKMAVRDLYQPVTSVRFGCRIWIMSNSEPNLRDHSSALANRFVWLPMTVSALGRENPKIKEAVRHEAPGLMVMALDGLMRIRAREKDTGRRYIEVCARSKAMTEEYVQSSAPLQAFVDQVLVYDLPRWNVGGPGADRLTQACLIDLYETWCEQQRQTPMKGSTFASRIKWAMRPYDVTQPRGQGTRARVVRGWNIRDEWMRNALRAARSRRPEAMHRGIDGGISGSTATFGTAGTVGTDADTPFPPH